MKIVLCVKQVPDTSDIKWTENNTIQREGLESIINPYDVYALESVLRIKNKYENIHVSALTMGPAQATDVLRKSLALGIDEAILLSDKKFSGADTYATGKTIARAISKKIPDFDLVVCGQFAVDGDTAQTGPSIANFLNVPQVTYVKQIVECSEDSVVVLRELDDYYETVKVTLPAVICVLKDSFEPSRALIDGIKKAQNSEIIQLGFEDLELDSSEVGLKGSPTYVSRAFRAPKKNVDCQILDSIDDFARVIKKCGGLDE